MIVDFHAHILPRCDHGCKDSAMSAEQLGLMGSFGTAAVVATSHFYPNEDSINSFLEGRDGALAAMRQKLPLHEMPVVYPAAEVLVCAGLHKMKGLEELTVSGTNIILLEMPFGRWNDELIKAALGVRDRGLVPVLAHIDRYDLGDVNSLLDEGLSAQVNAEAFGAFKNPKPYIELMRSGKVVALGSDLHGTKRGDYQRFVRMQKKLGSLADEVFSRSEALLQNAIPLYQPERETAERAKFV